MKIIIIGCGLMGYSHLKSFLNAEKKYEIDIIDNKKRINELKDKIAIKKNLCLNFSTKIPNNKNFDFAIISTNSKERYAIFTKLVLKNTVSFFLFEKFIFSKIIEYKKFFENYNKFSKKIMVNSFGGYIFKKCKIKKNRENIVNMLINVKEGTMFTGMIHYLDFFYLMTKKKMKINKNNKLWILMPSLTK